MSYCNSVRYIDSTTLKTVRFERTEKGGGVGSTAAHLSVWSPCTNGTKIVSHNTGQQLRSRVCMCVLAGPHARLLWSFKTFFFIIFPMPSAVRPAFTSPVSDTPSMARTVRLPRTMVTGRSFSYQFIITIITTWSSPPPPFLLVHHVSPYLTLFVYFYPCAHAHTTLFLLCRQNVRIGV